VTLVIAIAFVVLMATIAASAAATLRQPHR
jgi:hypothetical protein